MLLQLRCCFWGSNLNLPSCYDHQQEEAYMEGCVSALSSFVGSKTLIAEIISITLLVLEILSCSFGGLIASVIKKKADKRKINPTFCHYTFLYFCAKI